MGYAEVKSLVSIEQACNYFNIKHKGRKYHCPFHADKTPSAVVNGTHFHCFSCGVHFDIFDLAKAMGVSDETFACAFGYELRQGKIDHTQLAKIRKEREEKERLKALAEHQKWKLVACRRWFWGQTHDLDFFPVKAIDDIFAKGHLPLKYDVNAFTKSLYRRWKDEAKRKECVERGD